MNIIFPVPGTKVRLGTHEVPHADEAGAYWLIQKFADSKFLAKYSVRELVNGTSYRVIWVGVGLGPLDEHGGKEGECAMSLVAKALGVYDYPPLRRIVDIILRQDLNGGGDPLGIIRTANAMSRINPQDPREMLAWFVKALDAIYEEEIGFYEAEKEFPRAGQIKQLGKVRMVVIQSDSPYMAKIAFSKKAAVVLQRNSAGLTQIQARHDISLERAAREFSRIEPGKWYLKGKGLLLNGSRTYPEVPPTKFTLEYIEQKIRYYLG